MYDTHSISEIVLKYLKYVYELFGGCIFGNERFTFGKSRLLVPMLSIYEKIIASHTGVIRGKAASAIFV